MSLNKLRSSLRPKLNASFTNEQDGDPNALIKEIKQLKENFDSLRTPKLYQKIISQYKANLKNRRLADAISNKGSTNKSEFCSSNDILSVLRESNKLNENKYDQSQGHDDESLYSNKENFLDYSSKKEDLKFTSVLGVQTSPKQEQSIQELLKLKSEYDNQAKVVRIMEDDLSKIRIENIKLDKALKSAQENLAVLGKNQNNTSSAFSLPSEFKANWELLAKDQIINVFSDFIDNPILVTNLVQEIIMICYDQVKNVIKEVNCGILKILNLNEKSEAEIKKHLANFYQDNHSTIFKLDETRLQKIKTNYKKNTEKIFAHTYTDELVNFPQEDEGENVNNEDKSKEHPKSHDQGSGNKKEVEKVVTEGELNSEENQFKVEMREEYPEQFDSMLEMEDFDKFVNSLFYLCLFMLLSDPPLKVPIENFKNRKFVYRKFKKNDYICVDGFAKDNLPCLVLLPSVVRNNHPYSGIKPSVLILQEEFLTPKIRKLLEKFEKEEQEKLAKKQEREAQDEKPIPQEKNSVRTFMDDKTLPHSLNTTNAGEAQNNTNISHSHSNSLVLQSGFISTSKNEDKQTKDDKSQDNMELNFTLARNGKMNGQSSHYKILDNSKDHDDTIMPDVTLKPNKIPNGDMSLSGEETHNETIPMYLTERKERNKDVSTVVELTPHQDSSSSSRELSRRKRIPLPAYHMDSNLKSIHESGRRTNKSVYINPLSVRTNEQENKTYLGENLRQRITDIYDVLHSSNTAEKEKKALKASYSSEVALKNSNPHQIFNLQQLEESKDYSMNSYPTQRTNRGSIVHNYIAYRGTPDYKGSVPEVVSSRATSTNSRAYNQQNKENKYERDNSGYNDRYRSGEKDRYKVDDLRDKIRKSFLTTRNSQGGASETSIVSKINESSDMHNSKHMQPDFYSRTKDTAEVNHTISSLKQSIESLKNTKAQREKSRTRLQDSYEKLNNSLAGKITHQSDKFSVSLLKHLDNDNSHLEVSGKKGNGVVGKIVAEKMKTIERKYHSRQPTYQGSSAYEKHDKYEKDTDKSPQMPSHEYIKQKLNKLTANGRSISTNRTGYAGKGEEDSFIQANDSFRRDSLGAKGLNRIGSVNKLGKLERNTVKKENEENQQIFRALKNIYHKNS